MAILFFCIFPLFLTQWKKLISDGVVEENQIELIKYMVTHTTTKIIYFTYQRYYDTTKFEPTSIQIYELVDLQIKNHPKK
jgi:hypothetical protein